MRTNPRGFTLIEVTVAVALLATGVSGVAYLALASARGSDATRAAATVEWLAREKLEQLLALAWTADDGVVPVSDYATNVARAPVQGSGGMGLSVSSVDTLTSATPGFVDYADTRGAWVAGSGPAPSGARWQRRWSVQSVSGLSDTLLLQVVVSPVAATGAVMVRDAAAANGAWLVALRSRTAR
jgi:prepilin-type N-terminal cleavage/methylation domain-containing protein